MDRNSLINNLLSQPDKQWDVIVAGGGATGLGVALDAVTRGFSTLLLEQSDFSKGTSSRSTKLVHGGVRYLAQGDILLVKEALHERGLFLRNAPHLTANQQFIIPVYTIWDVILYTVGLKFYDLLAGRLSMGRSYYITKGKALYRLPLLKPKGLKGGIVYHDGQFDDSRMAVALASACVEKGGTVLNYMRLTGFLKDEKGKITGVRAKETLSGKEYSIKAGLVINATGVFADELHRMDDPESQPGIKPSLGVHLVLDAEFLQSSSAIMIPKTDDGRVLFAIPWYDKVVVGTTDTPLNSISLDPKPLEEEIDFILRTAGNYLTKPPLRKDVRCIFAGLRPLASDPRNPEATREVSRRHKITLSSSGLLSIIGGKWTSYRRMAKDTLDRAIREGILEKRKCVTDNFSFYRDPGKLSIERLKVYGPRANEIEEMIAEKPFLGEVIDSRLPYTRAEIIWICRNEMPVSLEDILARRTRAFFLDVRASLDIAPVVAGIMADEFGHPESWKKDETEKYRTLAADCL